MGVGKYSPTISAAYLYKATWWEKNGGGVTADGLDYNTYDKDGYDSYGYNSDGYDRAGYTEDDYISDGKWVRYDDNNDDYVYELYEQMHSEWGYKDGKPHRNY